MQDRWFHLSLNPEPWAIGDISTGKRNGKVFARMSPNPQLAAYKEAVAGELEGVQKLPPGEYVLTFFFWRVLDSYETPSGRRHRKHQADSTNMQKATEDALQGVLIDNDRNVRDIRSVVVEQGPKVKPAIVIRAAPWEGFDPSEVPQHMWDKIDEVITLPLPNNNAWPPTEGVF